MSWVDIKEDKLAALKNDSLSLVCQQQFVCPHLPLPIKRSGAGSPPSQGQWHSRGTLRKSFNLWHNTASEDVIFGDSFCVSFKDWLEETVSPVVPDLSFPEHTIKCWNPSSWRTVANIEPLPPLDNNFSYFLVHSFHPPFHCLSPEQGRNSLWESANTELCSFQRLLSVPCAQNTNSTGALRLLIITGIITISLLNYTCPCW